MRRKVAAVAAVLAVAGCGVSAPPSDATGEQIYRNLCANCHGANLEGRVGPALGPGSNAAAQPDSFIETTVLHGRGGMPSFRSVLDDDQVQRLIGYLREVQGE
ncbi:MAG: cytochrome c [Acidimicrobiales bacterium]|nr:cytochrome c [Acidimicrobiales bacterium]HLV90888.1 cytochrome c [Acidimicrobiia bacterium]